MNRISDLLRRSGHETTAARPQGNKKALQTYKYVQRRRLHIRPDIEQVLGNDDVARAARLEEGRLPARVPALDVRALGQEQ
eukprot:2823779-Alexandrium_andersonii.AAC.1